MDGLIKMMMTTVGMTALDTARYGLYAPNVTIAIDGLKYTIGIDRRIEVLTATVAITVINTARQRFVYSKCDG
jgi:hypothetical protein